ncbi:AMP-binding protein [Pseudoalteromonas sp. OFAV1]|uniref:AMP-binding protein n=1 Tax=Pseudoalteromonas sp. OFAV1 TaxID=2908892 RepID=UPI001F25C395|nr:AMP-binding protein [Pseudoalteromonas sp. OFAV1]MCF2902086.1 AMP-binding protein [Pseudoalteromonas sp. OFAV1]
MSNNSFELSISQNDIYYEALVNKNSPQFNIGGALILENVDFQTILRAHKEIVSNHDIFRLKIDCKGDSPLQYLSDTVDDSLQLLDFRNNKYSDDDAKLFIQNDFHTPIKLTDDSLFKAYVIQVDESRFYFVGLMHHIAIDGYGFGLWSHSMVKAIFHNELDKDEDWQSSVKRNLEGKNSKKHNKSVQYWQAKLGSNSDIDKIISNESASKNSSRLTVQLSKEQLALLNDINKKTGWDFSQQLRAAFSAAVALRFDSKSFLVTETFHNRRQHKDKNKIGVFVGESPLIVDLNNISSFDELVNQNIQLQKERFRLANIGKIGINKIMRELGVSEGISQFYFNYIKVKNLVDNQDNAVEMIYFPNNHSQAPLKFNVWDQHGRDSIRFEIDYNCGYFTKKDISYFVDSIMGMLYQVEQDHKVKLCDISYLTSNEHNELAELGNLNYEVCSELSGNTLTKYLYKQSIKTPDCIAIEQGGCLITYAELWNKAKNIAATLHANDVKSGDKVALESEHSISHFLLLFGIAVAGCTFVPIDPSLPNDRVKDLISISNSVKVFTISNKLKGLFDSSMIIDMTLTVEPRDNEYYLSLRREDSLLYVLFTSGSTGKPKGVEVSDYNFMSKLLSSHKAYKLPQGKILQFNNLSFDVFVEEIYLSLATNSTLVIPEGDCRDPEVFIKNIETKEIQTVLLTTSFFNHFLLYLESNNINSIKSLALVLVCGEELKSNFVERFVSRLGDQVALFNAYGPTEATVLSTYKAINTDIKVPSRVPIGTPLPMTSIMICGRNGNVLPSCVEGEIYIGGEGVARYASNLVNNPFFTLDDSIPSTSKNWYKSGDFGKWNDDGELMYLGRKDDEIKLGGYRTSISEISSIISQIKGVQDFIVMFNNESKVLNCFFLSTNEKIDYKKEVLGLLPYYLQPNVIVLDSFPKSSTGKINKKLLKELYSDLKSPEDTDLTKTEGEIAVFLKSILGEKYKGINTPFYQMGGNSIHAVSFSKFIKKEYELTVSLDKILEMQTVKKISLYIDDIKYVKNESQESSADSDDFGFSLTI